MEWRIYSLIVNAFPRAYVDANYQTKSSCTHFSNDSGDFTSIEARLYEFIMITYVLCLYFLLRRCHQQFLRQVVMW